MAPNRIPSLSLLLEKALAARGAGAAPLQLVVSNPLVKVLQSGLTGERTASHLRPRVALVQLLAWRLRAVAGPLQPWQPHALSHTHAHGHSTHPPTGDSAALLERVQLVPILGEAQIAIGGGAELTAICTPTPRWPDLMVVYDPDSRVAFTSKLFSAHVAPAAIGDKVGNDAVCWCVCGEGGVWLCSRVAAAFKLLSSHVSTHVAPAAISEKVSADMWAKLFLVRKEQCRGQQHYAWAEAARRRPFSQAKLPPSAPNAGGQAFERRGPTRRTGATFHTCVLPLIPPNTLHSKTGGRPGV